MSHDNKKVIEGGLERVKERELDVVGLELKKAYEYLLEKYHKEHPTK